jgi:FkbM family methyltransferase
MCRRGSDFGRGICVLKGCKLRLKEMINGLGYRVDPLVFSEADFDPARCRASTAVVDGVTYRWLVENPGDVIQSHHAAGELYEIDELRTLRSLVGRIEVFVDIGANVGNHAMFAALDMGAAHVIAFEPARKQHDILAVNIALNGVGDRFTVHKCALGDRPGSSWIAKPWDGNLGSARLNGTRSGEYIRVARGDDLLQDRQVSCIKIDVEGHEIKVLHGLRRTLRATRPFVYVEVDDSNLSAFEAFVQAERYVTSHAFARKAGSTCTNLLIAPA